MTVLGDLQKSLEAIKRPSSLKENRSMIYFIAKKRQENKNEIVIHYVQVI